MALSCDLLVAADNVKFGIPETGVGLFAGGGALIRLPGRVGYMKAMEMALTADPITAQEALSLGLISRITEPGKAIDRRWSWPSGSPATPRCRWRRARRSSRPPGDDRRRGLGVPEAAVHQGVHVRGRQGRPAGVRREAGASVEWALMAIDFASRPSTRRSATAVRTFVEDVIKPAERRSTTSACPSEPQAYIRIIFGMRKKAKDAGLWLPHMPKEWGGMGLGHVELAMVQAESGKRRYGPVGAQLPGARRGQHAHAAALGAPTSRRRSTSARCARARRARASP